MVAKAWAQLGAGLTFVPRLGPTSGFFSFFSLQAERSAHEGWKHVSSGGGIAEPCTPLAESCKATARAVAESRSRRCRPLCIAVHALPCRHAIAQPSSSRDMGIWPCSHRSCIWIRVGQLTPSRRPLHAPPPWAGGLRRGLHLTTILIQHGHADICQCCSDFFRTCREATRCHSCEAGQYCTCTRSSRRDALQNRAETPQVSGSTRKINLTA